MARYEVWLEDCYGEPDVVKDVQSYCGSRLDNIKTLAAAWARSRDCAVPERRKWAKDGGPGYWTLQFNDSGMYPLGFLCIKECG
jgi:hypothetical protein